jgi:lipopolysaccharide biosynthesis glycosyltransferase
MLAQEKNNKSVKKDLAPSIVHFTGYLKPWNYKSINPYKKEYYTILKKTDFNITHRAQNKTAVNVARRAARNLFVLMGILKY